MYRIILTKNGKYKKTLHKSMKRETSFINYHKFLDENKKVIFPREYINYNGIRKVNYMIYVVKNLEEGDEPRILRDKLGKLYKEKPLFGMWTVIDSHEFKVEETFWMYGHIKRL